MQVAVEDPKTWETVEFPCQRWFSTRDDDLDREHMASMNHDKTSLSYGLPNLGNADSYVSGTTGYWDKNDKSAVTVPYFGAWKNRVSVKSQV